MLRFPGPHFQGTNWTVKHTQMDALVASSCCSLSAQQEFCAATAKSVTLFHVESYTKAANKASSDFSTDYEDSSDGWPVRASIIASGSLNASFASSSSMLSCLALASGSHRALVANTAGRVAVASHCADSSLLACSDLFLPYVPDKSFVSSAAWSTISNTMVLLGTTSGRLTLVDTEVQYAPGHGSSSSTAQALSEWMFQGSRITAARYVPGTNTAVVAFLQPGAQRYGLLLCDPRMSDSGSAVAFGSEEPGGGDAGVDRSHDDESSSAGGNVSQAAKRKKKKRAVAASAFYLGLYPLPYADFLSCHVNQCSVATAGSNGAGVEILQLWDVRNARQPIHQMRTRRDSFSQIEWKPHAGTMSLLSVMKNGSMKVFDFSSITHVVDGGGAAVASTTAGAADVIGVVGGGARRPTLPQEIMDLMETSTASSGVTSIISSHLSVGACLPVHAKPPFLRCVTWLDRPQNAILGVDDSGSVRLVPARLGITTTWGSSRQPIIALGNTVAESTASQNEAANRGAAGTAVVTPPSLFPNIDIEELMIQRLSHGFSADLGDALAAAGKTKEHALGCLVRYLRLMIGKGAAAFHCSRASGILHILKSPAAVDEATGETTPAARELILSAMGWPNSSTGLHHHDMTETSRDHIEKAAAVQIFTHRWNDAAQWLSIHHRINVTYGILAPLLQCALSMERQQQQANQQLQISAELADQLKNGISFWLQSAITYVMRSSSEQSIIANAKIPFCDKIALATAILPQHADLMAALELLLGELDCSFERCLLLGFGEEGITEMQRYIDVSGDFQLAACVFSPFAAKNHPTFSTWSDEYRKFLAANGLFFHRARYDLAVKKHSLVISSATSAFHERPRPHCEVLCACGNPMHEILSSRPSTPMQQGLRSTYSTPTANVCRSLDCKPMCVVCSRRIEGPTVETCSRMWYAWCSTCLHGGHYQHLREWFSKHKQCPVECCSCECCSV